MVKKHCCVRLPRMITAARAIFEIIIQNNLGNQPLLIFYS